MFINQITKSQHYVPQFLLKGFDAIDRETPKVNIFDVDRSVVRKDQPVKDIFSQNYFYDINNEIENFLSSCIEAPASEIINRFRCNDFSKLNDGGTKLIKFMCCQNSRTVEGREDSLSFINSGFHQLFSDFSRLNDLGIADPTKFSIRPADKNSMRSFNAEQALNGVVFSKGLEDLRFHILLNSTDREFIISDHAISRYNWLYRDLEDHRVGSMLAKGVQMYLPLSPRMYLCAYDSKVYKFGERSSDISELKCVKDVDWLNQLQIRNTNTFIAFSSVCMDDYVMKLCKLLHGKKIYIRKSIHLGQEHIDENKLKTRHMIYTEQVKINYKPNFFKVLKKSRKYSYFFEERSPELSKAVMMLQEEMKKDRAINKPLTRS